MKKNEILEKITNKILDEMKRGVNPWIKPWSYQGKATRNSKFFAVNYVTKKPYEGINAIVLEAGYYVTYKQAIALNGHPRSGYSQMVVFIADTKGEIKEALLKEQVLEEYRKGEYEEFIKLVGGVQATLFVGKHKATVEIMDNGKIYGYFKTLKNYYVWNVKDVEGIKIKEITKEKEDKKVEPFKALENGERVIENYVKGSGLGGFFNDGGNDAYYTPTLDEIHLPRKEAFGKKPNEYYSTAFHEMTHSTGYCSRLNREGIVGVQHSFGSQTYSKEELIAEIGASYLMGALRIDTEGTISNSASYLACWASRIKEDKTLREKIMIASSEAKKAFTYILGFSEKKPRQ